MSNMEVTLMTQEMWDLFLSPILPVSASMAVHSHGVSFDLVSADAWELTDTIAESYWPLRKRIRRSAFFERLKEPRFYHFHCRACPSPFLLVHFINSPPLTQSTEHPEYSLKIYFAATAMMTMSGTSVALYTNHNMVQDSSPRPHLNSNRSFSCSEFLVKGTDARNPLTRSFILCCILYRSFCYLVPRVVFLKWVFQNNRNNF